jgi:hypothetical protein
MNMNGKFFDRIDTLLQANTSLAMGNAATLGANPSKEAKQRADDLVRDACLTDIRYAIWQLTAQVEKLMAAAGLDVEELDASTLDELERRFEEGH